MKKIFRMAIAFIMLFIFNNAKSQTSAPINEKPLSDSIANKVEIEAYFPGGPQAWLNYITNAIMDNQKKLKKSDYGTCIVKFIVDKKGKVSNVEATTMQGSRLAKVAVDAIENGPRWKPAIQNGVPVNAYRLQPITLTDPDKKKSKE
jgi:periplasmic protein TonB